MPNNYVKNTEQKEPVKCWDCHRPHYEKGLPEHKDKLEKCAYH